MKIRYEKYLKEYARKLRNNPTYSEAKLWRYLKGDAFYGYDFHRQKPIGKYIVDFYCHALRLIIEIDGNTHNDESVIMKDMIRDEYLASLGLVVMRIDGYDVIHNTENVIREIENYILKRNAG